MKAEPNKESGPSLRPGGRTRLSILRSRLLRRTGAKATARQAPALRKHPTGVRGAFSDEGTNPKLEILRSLMWDMGYEICAGTRLVASISDLTSHILI
jgi:hypothetical protein